MIIQESTPKAIKVEKTVYRSLQTWIALAPIHVWQFYWFIFRILWVLIVALIRQVGVWLSIFIIMTNIWTPSVSMPQTEKKGMSLLIVKFHFWKFWLTNTNPEYYQFLFYVNFPKALSSIVTAPPTLTIGQICNVPTFTFGRICKVPTFTFGQICALLDGF